MDDTDTKNRTQRQRSPNYPIQALDWAVDAGLKLLDKEGLHAVSPDIIANHLGYKDSKNGSAGRILANLKAFGILQKATNGKLGVSQEVRRFKLHPTEEDKAIIIQQWLKRPLLYSKLLDKYGDNLPSDKALIFELVDEHGFTESSAQNAIDVFRASVKYADQIINSVANQRNLDVATFREDEEEKQEETIETTNTRTMQLLTPSPQLPSIGSNQIASFPSLPGGVRYPIRLAGGRMAWIEVPDPFYEMDKDRLKAQLEIIGTADEDEVFQGKTT